MGLAEKISEAELEVMKVLWRQEKPVSFTDIRVKLHALKGWEKSTINTLVRRLVEKGVITARELDKRRYTPNISREAYVQAEEQSLLNKLYDGSAKNFVAALCHRGTLSREDIEELRVFFQMGVTGNESVGME